MPLQILRYVFVICLSHVVHRILPLGTTLRRSLERHVQLWHLAFVSSVRRGARPAMSSSCFRFWKHFGPTLLLRRAVIHRITGGDLGLCRLAMEHGARIVSRRCSSRNILNIPRCNGGINVLGLALVDGIANHAIITRRPRTIQLRQVFRLLNHALSMLLHRLLD